MSKAISFKCSSRLLNHINIYKILFLSTDFEFLTVFPPVSQWPVHRILLRACRGWVSRCCYHFACKKFRKVQQSVLQQTLIWFCIYPAGWYEDSVFHVNGFGFPPTEPSSATRWAKEPSLFLILPYSSIKSTLHPCALLPGHTTVTWTSSVVRPRLLWRPRPSSNSWKRRMRMPCLWLFLTCGWTTLKCWKN